MYNWRTAQKGLYLAAMGGAHLIHFVCRYSACAVLKVDTTVVLTTAIQQFPGVLLWTMTKWSLISSKWCYSLLSQGSMFLTQLFFYVPPNSKDLSPTAFFVSRTPFSHSPPPHLTFYQKPLFSWQFDLRKSSECAALLTKIKKKKNTDSVLWEFCTTT